MKPLKAILPDAGQGFLYNIFVFINQNIILFSSMFIPNIKKVKNKDHAKSDLIFAWSLFFNLTE